MTSTPVRLIFAVFLMALVGIYSSTADAADEREYVLGPGDIVRITVFQNPDLTTETRVSESGTLTFPLIGSIQVGGQSTLTAEKTIAARLRDGGFVLQPQVNVLPLQIRGNQVAVLGQVNRPGRFPLETANLRLTDMLATAGGIAASGADTVVLIGMREGKQVRREIDVPTLFASADLSNDLRLSGGDIIYVQRAPMYYIYGEVQRPGAFRLERRMSVMQGLATGGGTTLRGTTRGLRIHRRDAEGNVQVFEPKLDDLLQADDVIHVRESLF
ncbi:polysaccharide export protein EpsE [Parazoarcus communis]|uniref:Polysaccharide export protein EpsE n=1 Tax=Parazoarcus communis SWub3 = DSM 12120 TaxID=1121029 RepID=A0A323UPR3_9RHOO|nr:polysaccharide export protein EpsE [Parazoarcus communis]NMG72271.1 polysaccharide export protein EpsE [Parazoarcus communis SWub3 = DSM 12120]PZA14484.1 polysaccharide export protein EpsE [Azoarcus communis] [Parazoarcus communis SWub3 = DSM 12120]